MHSQRESKLLSAPAEIRRAIYANIIPSQIHAFLSQGRIQLSVCLQPNLGDDCHDGREREIRGEESSQAKWARRLRSSWGPHWECEQVALAENIDLHEHCRNHIYNLLFVCKKMFLDVCDFVSENKVTNVTDLDTLQVLLQKTDELDNGLNYPWSLWESIFPGIQKLNVTLRLPLAFYRALEEDEVLVSEAGHDLSAGSATYATWAGLWSAICQLQRLRSLHIWLDHDDKSSWSVVKERLALHRVIAILAAHMQARSGEENLMHMDITFNLPKLHPRIARPDTHFVQESAPPPFIIERRIRQRNFCEEGPGGNLSVIYNPDFPIMCDLPDFLDLDINGEPNMNGEPRMTLLEVEEFERKLWEEGTDVEQLLLGGYVCF